MTNEVSYRVAPSLKALRSLSVRFFPFSETTPKDEAFASPGEEYAAAFYWLSRIDWLDLDEAKVIAQQASERVIAVHASSNSDGDDAIFAVVRERLTSPKKGVRKHLGEL